MNIQPSHPASNTECISYLGSFVPGATIAQRAFPRERFSVAGRAIVNSVRIFKTTAFIISAIIQLQHKMAVSKAAVVRRYNKGQQSDCKLAASPSVCSRCAKR